MELTSQVMRQVEFGSELRGYKTAEVDEFLEAVAVGVDEMRNEVSSLKERLARAEELATERTGFDDEESIRRTLVLAQRTADLAIKEAQEEAAQVLDAARADAERIVGEARQSADRLVSEADRRLRDEVARLSGERDRLQGEIDALKGLLAAERERLTESLDAMLRFVEKNLVPSPATSEAPPAPAAAPARQAPAAPNVDELEAAIAEDAAAAGPASAGRPSELDQEWEAEGKLRRPSLTALPPLDDAATSPEASTERVEMGGHAGSPAS